MIITRSENDNDNLSKVLLDGLYDSDSPPQHHPGLPSSHHEGEDNDDDHDDVVVDVDRLSILSSCRRCGATSALTGSSTRSSETGETRIFFRSLSFLGKLLCLLMH